jgi:hypothetical protein
LLPDISAIYHDSCHARYISQVQVLSEDKPPPRTFESKSRHTEVTSTDLSNRWLIGLSTAAQTLKATTQRFARSAILPLSRRYRADRMHLTKRLQGVFATDTLVGTNHPTLDGNKYAQVFSNSQHFIVIYPMASKAMAGQALREFIREYGVPEELHFDGSLEQNGPNTEFTRLIREHGIKVHRSEPHRPQQNPAEGAIRELKRRWYRLVNRYNVPLRLWDYGMRWVTEIMCRTTNSIYSLAGRTPLEAITGETPDISEYLDFGFYDYVWYKDNAGFGPNEVGRWLGVSHNIGNAMSYWILKSTGSIVSRSTVQRITDNEKGTDEVKALL